MGSSLTARLDALVKPAVWTLRPKVLLCSNIPKPMHGTAPRIVLGQEWWDETRRAAYASTNYHCIACGVHKSRAKHGKWLEGHEMYETDYALGLMVYVETVPLCHYCHNYIHSGRLQMLLDKREIEQQLYDAIMKHGDEVLAAAGVKRPNMMIGRVADWKKWRLVIDGKKYKGRFKSERQWLKEFGK